jgi:hypothetical protein
MSIYPGSGISDAVHVTHRRKITWIICDFIIIVIISIIHSQLQRGLTDEHGMYQGKLLVILPLERLKRRQEKTIKMDLRELDKVFSGYQPR